MAIPNAIKDLEPGIYYCSGQGTGTFFIRKTKGGKIHQLTTFLVDDGELSEDGWSTKARIQIHAKVEKVTT